MRNLFAYCEVLALIIAAAAEVDISLRTSGRSGG
jgi:hypothetical protein